MFHRSIIAGLLVVCGISLSATDSQPRYFTCPVSRLEILEGTLPLPRYGNQPVFGEAVDLFQDRWTKFGPLRMDLDGPGAIEVVIQSGSGAVRWEDVFLAIKTERAGPITGTFKYWKEEQLQTVRWRLPKEANTTRAADWFNFGKASRLHRTYLDLLRDPATPGQAWFRHRMDEIHTLKTPTLALLWRTSDQSWHPKSDLKPEPMEPDFSWVGPITVDNWTPGRRWTGGNDHVELLSGGRAISENLQLDRELNVRPDNNQANVKIADLKGIDIREYDWNPHIRGLRPQLDPLATMIPADQHAVFFPHVPAAVAVLEEIERTGMEAWNISTPRGVDDRLSDRYFKQLALPAAQLGKLLPASLVNNVAITGSDLYFDTGTDVAVLFATTKPAVVRQLLIANWPAVRTANADVEEKEETIGVVSCRTLKSPDRRVCCYSVEFQDLVLLTNSPAQVRRIIEVRSNKSPALANLAEYTFFRDRYRRGESDESAFALLSDAAIRRWCGPMWRIGHQRRIQTAAYLADVQAKLVQSTVSGATIRTMDNPRLGTLDVISNQVFSKSHGTRLFQTPIAETEINQVTKAEADAYNLWRDSYQKNWSQFFDPIAVRVSVKPDRLAMDMSVMPLIAETGYREFIALSTGAQLPSNAGDPHPDALVQFVIGFNRKSDQFKKKIDDWFGMGDSEFHPRLWLGDWVSVYVDDDPIWSEFMKSPDSEWEFWRNRNYQLPVGISIAFVDKPKLELFIKDLVRNQFFPKQETIQASHRKVDYHSASNGGMTFYSLILPDQWVLSLNERVIHRAIDRHLARKEGKPMAKTEWLGDSLAFTAKPQAVKYLSEWWGRSRLSQLQQAAWANIPILNEWHQLDAKIDPVAFHEKWWGERLLEPAGGKYVWNPTDGTMESTTLGHPGRPKGTRATLPASLASLRNVNLGITFEREGLRARIDIRREK